MAASKTAALEREIQPGVMALPFHITQPEVGWAMVARLPISVDLPAL